jgi:hypothetical protein
MPPISFHSVDKYPGSVGPENVLALILLKIFHKDSNLSMLNEKFSLPNPHNTLTPLEKPIHSRIKITPSIRPTILTTSVTTGKHT